MTSQIFSGRGGGSGNFMGRGGNYGGGGNFGRGELYLHASYNGAGLNKILSGKRSYQKIKE